MIDVRSFVIGMSLISIGSATALLTGCGRDHQDTPSAPAPRATANKPTSATKPAWDSLHFAKDGKCADKLVRAYDVQSKLRRESEKVLAQNARAYQVAKAENNPDLELWRAPLREGYLRLSEAARPFDEKYGAFACPRRQTGEILSSDTLGQGLAQLKSFVETEVGTKPPQKNTKQ